MNQHRDQGRKELRDSVKKHWGRLTDATHIKDLSQH